MSQIAIDRVTPLSSNVGRWQPGRDHRPATQGARCATLDYDKANLIIASGSYTERQLRVSSCAKEPWTVAWIETMQPGEILWDIGANVGAYSLVAASRGVEVYAFEPAYINYARLCQNALANRLGHQIHPLSIALSDKMAIDQFIYPGLNPGVGSCGLGHLAWERLEERWRCPVLSVRADDLIGLGLPAPHHVKLDADGSEVRILDGCAQLFASGNFRSLMLESPTHELPAVEAAMAKTNLRLIETIARPTYDECRWLHYERTP